MANGNIFSIGPSDGWQWQQGEQLIITFINGKSVYWTYQPAPACGSLYDGSGSSSSNNNMVLQERIRQLEWKIKDAERSLSLYEEWNNKNLSISNG